MQPRPSPPSSHFLYVQHPPNDPMECQFFQSAPCCCLTLPRPPALLQALKYMLTNIKWLVAASLTRRT
jgi:hypothetical protein